MSGRQRQLGRAWRRQIEGSWRGLDGYDSVRQRDTNSVGIAYGVDTVGEVGEVGGEAGAVE